MKPRIRYNISFEHITHESGHVFTTSPQLRGLLNVAQKTAEVRNDIGFAISELHRVCGLNVIVELLDGELPSGAALRVWSDLAPDVSDTGPELVVIHPDPMERGEKP